MAVSPIRKTAYAMTAEGIPDYPLWRTDTKAIVGSVLLAVCFSINMQITERLDTVTGSLIAPIIGVPAANWLGYTFLNLWFPVTVIYFGLLGGLIIANFNPIIAVLTATHALAWSFFFFNMAWAIPNALLFKYWIRNGYKLTYWRFVLTCGVGQAFSALCFFGLMKIVFPGGVWWGYIAIPFWNWIMFLPGATLGFYFYKAVKSSGVLE